MFQISDDTMKRYQSQAKPSTPTPPRRSIAEIQKAMTIAEQESTAAIQQAKDSLAKSETRGLVPEEIQSRRDLLTALERDRDYHFATLRDELKAAQEYERQQAEATLKAEREAAAVNDAAMREDLRREWLLAGGDPDQFEGAYPALKARLVSDKVMQNAGRLQREYDERVQRFMKPTS